MFDLHFGNSSKIFINGSLLFVVVYYVNGHVDVLNPCLPSSKDNSGPSLQKSVERKLENGALAMVCVIPIESAATETEGHQGPRFPA